jgi:hypothetical protein
MKKYGLGLMVLLALTALTIYILNHKPDGTIDPSISALSIEDTSSITRVFLTDKSDHRILLDRIDEGTWKVNQNYMARQDVVQNLLGTIKLQKLRTPVPKSMFKNVVTKIAGTHTKVEVYTTDNKQPELIFYVGGSTQDQNGTFMLREGAEEPVIMHIEGHYGFLGPRYTVNLNAWKSNAVFSYPDVRLKEIKRIELRISNNPKASFAIEMRDDQPILLDFKGNPVNEVNPERIYDYLRRFQKVHFEGWEETKTEDFRDTILAGTPLEIYTLTDIHGKTTEVRTYLKPAPEGGMDYEDQPITHDLDRMYGLINNSDFVLLQYYVFDPLRVDINWFTAPAIVDK